MQQRQSGPINVIGTDAVIDDWSDDDGPLTAAAVTRKLRERFDAAYPPGTRGGDLTRFVEAEYLECDRWEAAVALTRHMSPRGVPRFANPDTRAAIAERIRADGRDAVMHWLHSSVFPMALQLAWESRKERVRVRIGQPEPRSEGEDPA